MRFSTVESILPASMPSELPVRLEQRSSDVATLLKLVILLPATIALLTPFLLVGKALASDPAVRAVLAAKPASMLQLASGLAFWAVLFAWPLKRLTEGLAQGRSVTIADGVVGIAERGLLGERSWSTPLAGYDGVVHHVRSSMSGVRHELILVHRDRRNSVLLSISDRFAQSEIDRVAVLLGQRELPSRTIYARRPGAAGRPAEPAFGAVTTA